MTLLERPVIQTQEPVRETGAWRECRGTPLVIQGLHKSFGDNHVLNGIELNVYPGEFVAVVGRSGCGKSTLLRLIAGLESITQGNIWLNEGLVTGLHPETRIMFQEARLLPWQRVLANVALGLKPEELPLAAWALEQVGLKDRERDWPAILSGGQKQRVALARALVSRPRLMLLDEPLGALDALTRLEMQRLISQLWEEQGFTALLVTHDVDEAVALADRIVVLEEGQIVLQAQVALPRPRHRNDRRFGEITEVVLDRILSGPAQVSQANMAER